MPRRILAATLLVVSSALAQTPAPPAWIAKSNAYTQQLLDLDKKYSPESASYEGLAEYDPQISVPTLANDLAERKDTEAVLAKLVAARKIEPKTKEAELVAQDLDILIDSTNRGFRSQDFSRTHKVPFINASAVVFGGLQALLDDQVTPERRKAALIRLHKYVGAEPGYQPMTAILLQRIQEQMPKPGVIYPSKTLVETELGRNSQRVEGIPALFKKYNLTGWEADFATLQKQLTDYDAWVRTNLLPKARTDFRLPPEEYAIALSNYGVDLTPTQLATLGHTAYAEIQAQMKTIAAQIAKQRNLPSSDYRDVIRELKKDQLKNDEILPFYEKRLHEIEAIIVKQRLVSLPDRPAIIRLGTPAESVQQPAPHMVPPPFLHNTGQRGVFVLPLNMPAAPGQATSAKVDDYTYDAATWTLIAHEARPGHELQFDSMVEHGVSNARAIYAFNSTNAEGWGLYAEYITLPYMPLEGQLISLQFRLLRAARIYLDPELQAGKVTPDQALHVLTDEVVMSVPFATQEVERYTFRSPGQATSYYYGYTRLLSLRKEAEQNLGAKFDPFRLHNFILSQGLLPPALMQKAVEEDFIRTEKSR
jgi:hypothetical protein